MIPLPPAPDRFAVLALEVMAILAAALVLYRLLLSAIRSTWTLLDDRQERRERSARNSKP